MEYVLGIDLGTSAVKVSAVDKTGKVVEQASADYPLIQEQAGYSEQRPNDWVRGVIECIKALIDKGINADDIKGISFSGQMHGLVLLDKNNKVLRPAILWNDTRTTKQCNEIIDKIGKQFIKITGNNALEGFTLPKILWVRENEPQIWQQVNKFLLPKDYIRFMMTGKIGLDYSDATGTVMLDIKDNNWSKEILKQFNIPASICPPLISSLAYVGNITPTFAQKTGLNVDTKVFAGGGDNACGATGAGILEKGMGLSSIGTSGVVLKYEGQKVTDYAGQLQMEDHTLLDTKYSMGVTLAAGFALSWFKKTFYAEESYQKLTQDAGKSPIGAHGLIFTPYLMGERTPYEDAKIRGSFIGVSSNQTKADFARSVMEGITFSFKDILTIYQQHDNPISKVVAIGGGAKSDLWLQMQADIFDVPVVSLKNEQGPGLGAAMIAATGLGWFEDLQACTKEFVHYGKKYIPDPINVDKYQKIYEVYHKVYSQTKNLCYDLSVLQ